MPYAAQSVLNCPSGQYITRMRTKNQYNQWITGLELTCSDGTVVSALNDGDGPFGQETYNGGVQVTAKTYETPGGFDSYNAQKKDYWTFNIDTYNQGVPVSNGTNIVNPGWDPTRTDYYCPTGTLVSGMNIWPCLGGSCSLFRVDNPICEGKSRTIDGGWSDWSPWSNCAVCGENVMQHRTRTCTNPTPANGGAQCIGDSKEERKCPVPLCPIDGGWSDWSSYGDCVRDPTNPALYSKKRSRSCTNPMPQYGGLACTGSSVEYLPCEPPLIPIIVPPVETSAPIPVVTASSGETTVISVTPTSTGTTTTTSVVTPPVVNSNGTVTSTATTTHPDGSSTTTELLHDPNNGNVVDAKTVPESPNYTLYFIVILFVAAVLYFALRGKNNSVKGGDVSMDFDTYYDGKLGGDYTPDYADITGSDLGFASIPSSVVY